MLQIMENHLYNAFKIYGKLLVMIELLKIKKKDKKEEKFKRQQQPQLEPCQSREDDRY